MSDRNDLYAQGGPSVRVVQSLPQSFIHTQQSDVGHKRNAPTTTLLPPAKHHKTALSGPVVVAASNPPLGGSGPSVVSTATSSRPAPLLTAGAARTDQVSGMPPSSGVEDVGHPVSGNSSMGNVTGVDSQQQGDNQGFSGDLKCPHCPRIYKREGNLHRHIEKHASAMAGQLPSSGVSSSSSSAPAASSPTNAPTVQPAVVALSLDTMFKCTTCDIPFKKEGNLIRHMWHQHGIGQPSTALVLPNGRTVETDPVGNVVPTSISDANAGVERSSDKMDLPSSSGPTSKSAHVCSECGRIFIHASHLARHLGSHGVKRVVQHICQTCGKVCKWKSDLVRHQRTHTGVRPFKCVDCGKYFACSGDLTCHLRVHTGEKPYSCKICGKSFAESGNRTRHLLTHTKRKPFPCSKCDKVFSRRGNLKAHMRTHNSPIPILCPVPGCGKPFSQKSSLRRHAKKHGPAGLQALEQANLASKATRQKAAASSGSGAGKGSVVVRQQKPQQHSQQHPGARHTQQRVVSPPSRQPTLVVATTVSTGAASSSQALHSADLSEAPKWTVIHAQTQSSHVTPLLSPGASSISMPHGGGTTDQNADTIPVIVRSTTV